MTDKAPERIWATPETESKPGQVCEGYAGMPYADEYVRADIYEALEADRDALREALPDEIDLYRLLRKHGARSYPDAARVIATHLAALQEKSDD